MFTVCLIGPDGAGKTTIARALEHELPMPVRYLYMGVSADSSNRLLPTTKVARAVKRARGALPDTAGPRDPSTVLEPRAKGPVKRAAASARAGLRLANRLAEEWSRQYVAWKYVRQGAVVVFDRHFFFDYYAYDVAGGAGRPLSRRLHGFLLAHAYPKADLVIYLDAPPEVLLARKGEGTIETLARRRQEYLSLADVAEHFAVVDASQPLDAVTRQVVALITDFAEARRAGGPATRPLTNTRG